MNSKQKYISVSLTTVDFVIVFSRGLWAEVVEGVEAEVSPGVLAGVLARVLVGAYSLPEVWAHTSL